MWKDLLEQEIRAVDLYFAQNGLADSLHPRHVGGSRGFVRAALNAHRSLISRYDGLEVVGDEDIRVVPDRIIRVKYRLAFNQEIPEDSIPFFRQKLAPEDGVIRYHREYENGLSEARVRKGQAVSRVLEGIRASNFSTYMGPFWSSTQVKLTWAPSAFIRLGHMQEGSCYRAGQWYQHSKFNLAMMNGAVVVHALEGETIKGRAWGVLAPRGAYFGNAYKVTLDHLTPGLLKLVEQHTDRRMAVFSNLDTNTDHDRRTVPREHPLRVLQSEKYLYADGAPIILHPENQPPDAVFPLIREYARRLRNRKLAVRQYSWREL